MNIHLIVIHEIAIDVHHAFSVLPFSLVSTTLSGIRIFYQTAFR
jgi:hypothetical protein